MQDQIVGALEKIIQGVQLLGDGLASLIRIVLASLGVNVPDIAIRLAAIIIIILTLYKLGGAVSKIVLYVMIFLLISLFAGLIPAVGELFSGIS